VNKNSPRIDSLNVSGSGCWLTAILFSLLLGAVGLGWLVNGFLILLAFLSIAPVIGWYALQWWVRSKLAIDRCPVCSYEFTGFNNTECRCPNCGEPLKIAKGRFERITLPGTIDINAIEVPVQVLEESSETPET
jgi:hypothetical protein